VAASGTGLQQVTSLVDRWGAGVSQAIGTGGRDLKAEVGGATMLRGLTALGRDAATKVIVLISKPPAQAVAERVIEAAGTIDKPVVICFLGADPGDRPERGIYAAATLEQAAGRAVELAGGAAPERTAPADSDVSRAMEGLAPGQCYLRGLFSGGTFCYEALLLLTRVLGPVYSNTPVDPALRLPDPWRSRAHTVVDLGDDEFTRGRPHPMIDPGLRNERILREAADPEVAVILLDVVLGYGAHADPAASIAPAIEAAHARAREAGRSIAFVASVCGTARDPQDLGRQEAVLRDAGVLLADSNAAAVGLAARIAAREAHAQRSVR
jgi:FdrA protein